LDEMTSKVGYLAYEKIKKHAASDRQTWTACQLNVMTPNKTPDNNDDYDDEVTAQYRPRLYISADWNNCTPRSHFHQLERKLKLKRLTGQEKLCLK